VGRKDPFPDADKFNGQANKRESLDEG